MRAWLLILVGCSGGGGDAPVDAPSTVDSAPLCTHLQNLKLFRAKAQTSGTAAGRFDGNVCIEGRTDITCATPDTEGSFEICVPSAGDFGLRFTKTGFENTLYLHGPEKDPEPFGAYTIADDAYAKAMVWEAIGGTYPPATKGNLVVVVKKLNADQTVAPLAGVSMAVVPSAGLTVRYYGADGKPDQTLNTTSSAGVAVIANVPPGALDLQINGAGTCSFLTGGYVSPDNSQHARVTVVANTTIVAALKCPP